MSMTLNLQSGRAPGSSPGTGDWQRAPALLALGFGEHPGDAAPVPAGVIPEAWDAGYDGRRRAFLQGAVGALDGGP